MRTTLNIENDVLLAVWELARRQRTSAGAVISDLARLSLMRASVGTEALKPTAFYGFRPISRRGGLVSNELINRLREGDVY